MGFLWGGEIQPITWNCIYKYLLRVIMMNIDVDNGDNVRVARSSNSMLNTLLNFILYFDQVDCICDYSVLIILAIFMAD